MIFAQKKAASVSWRTRLCMLLDKMLLVSFFYHKAQFFFRAVTNDSHGNDAVNNQKRNFGLEVYVRFDFSSVPRNDFVAWFKSANIRGASVRDGLDDDSCFSGLRREGRRHEPDKSVADAPMDLNFQNNKRRMIGRNGKPNADASASGGCDDGVDADNLAEKIKKGAAGVSLVYGGIGLDVFNNGDPSSRWFVRFFGNWSSFCRDNSQCYRVPDGK